MRDWIAAPGSPRVLIVDDEPAICSALVQVLRRAGFDRGTRVANKRRDFLGCGGAALREAAE